MTKLLYDLLTESPYWIMDRYSQDCTIVVGLRNFCYGKHGITSDCVTIKDVTEFSMAQNKKQEMIILIGGISLKSGTPVRKLAELLCGLEGIPCARMGYEFVRTDGPTNIGEVVKEKEITEIVFSYSKYNDIIVSVCCNKDTDLFELERDGEES